MKTDSVPSSSSLHFTLAPTHDPMQLRLEFHEPAHHAHTIVIERRWIDKITPGTISLTRLAGAAVQLTLSYEPRFNFPPVFSLGLLARVFPGLEAELTERFGR